MKPALLENNVYTTTNHTGVLTDTLLIAEAFGRKHYDVLKIVRRLERNNAIGDGNISLSSYTTKQNKLAKMYQLDRKAFIVLALSFTGADADRLKGRFVDMFLNQEKELSYWRDTREEIKAFHLSYTDAVNKISLMLKEEGSKQYTNIYPTIQRQINKAATLKPTPRGADNGEYREKLSKEQLEDIQWFEEFVKKVVFSEYHKDFTGRQLRGFIKQGLSNYYFNQKQKCKSCTLITTFVPFIEKQSS